MAALVANLDKSGTSLEADSESPIVKWSAPIGSAGFGTPVISDGLLWVGGNNQSLRNPDLLREAALLRCFDVSTGELRYDYASPRLRTGRVNDPSWQGLGCSPLIEGDRMWFVTNRCETICMDISPLKRRPPEPPLILWKVDMLEELGVFPRPLIMGPSRLCSIGPSYRGRIFVTTNNGVDRGQMKVVTPRAPSLVCFDKETGQVRWERPTGTNTLYSELASPLVAEIDGRGHVVVPQGDGWIRSFDPLTGKLLWEFDINFKESRFDPGGFGPRNYFLSTPVLYDNRIYIASGQGAERGQGPGRLVCIDPTKSGDISSELAVGKDGGKLPPRRARAVDTARGERVVPNPNSGLVWEFTKRADQRMDRTLSNVAIHNGLLIAPDINGFVHCLDAETGKIYWHYDALAAIWSSPLIVGDLVVICDEDGDVVFLRLSADPRVAMREAPQIVTDGRIYSSPIFAGGTLYVTTQDTLYAIQIVDRGNEDVVIGAAPQPGRTSVPRVGSEQRVNTGPRQPKPIYVPTPHDVVGEMLRLAGVTEKDTVADLGSGDGRVVINAGKRYRAKSIGYEIDPALVQISREKIQENEVEDLIIIELDDMYTADLRDVSVVAVYLYPTALEKLKGQFRTMKAGSRIVSHHFEIPGVEPTEILTVASEESGDSHRLLLYTTPLRAKEPKAR